MIFTEFRGALRGKGKLRKRVFLTSLAVSILLTSMLYALMLTTSVSLESGNGLGYALSFDGVDDYVEVADSDTLKGMEQLTLEVWIKPESFPQYAGIIGKWRWPTTMHYILGYFSGGMLWFFVGNDTSADSISVTQPPLGAWTHIVAVFNGSVDLRIYYNGTLKGCKITTISRIGTGSVPLYIGKYAIYQFNGTIDEVRIYSRALTEEEIMAHYNNGLGQYGRPEAGLVGLWHFDKDVYDYSGYGNHGSIKGNPEFVYGLVPFPDVSISDVALSATKVLAGETIKINVIAENVGAGAYENFTVYVYANETMIGLARITYLLKHASTTLNFTWDTTGVPLGVYTIKANATEVPGEINFENNEKIGGTVWIVKHPIANFTYYPVPALENQTITFDASGSTPNGGTIVKYTWDFGDGNTTSIETPVITHVYASHGTYNVTLTILDSEGLTNSTWMVIGVLRRDVAVVDVMPEYNFTYKGWWPVNINVTVVNEGNFSETVTLDLYYNITEGLKVGTQTFTLDVGEAKTLTFAWNTADVTPCRNYTITAKATIEFDSDQKDNILESPMKVKINMLGDTNGDGVVDISDIARVSMAFGSRPGHSRWDPFADMNRDNRIDIRDIAIVSKNFGSTCP
jgi:PKD repeat protein